jgi:hypothetical protein
MKYRTVIELISEANDKDDAFNIAGDYLRGQVDFGVDMRCKTTKLWEHKAMKYGLTCLFAALFFSTLAFNVTTIGGEEMVRSSYGAGIQDNFTIMPVLKTKHRSDFKKEWQTKNDEVTLKYLKK